MAAVFVPLGCYQKQGTREEPGDSPGSLGC